VFIVIFALQASVGPVVGQNLGAGKMDRVHRALYLSDRFLILYAAVFAAVLFALAPKIAVIFNDDPIVVATATSYLRIVPFTYWAFALMMIAIGAFNSLGRPMPPAILTFVKFFVVYLPLAWLLSHRMGITGIFWANATSHLLLGIVTHIWLTRELKSVEAERQQAQLPAEGSRTTTAGDG
jgi:Na+-driven multidrug efflux pump